MRDNSKPASFADYSLRKGKQTRTETFLKRLDEIIDWSFISKIHKDLYPSKGWRKPISTQKKIKIVLLQKLYWLSDTEAEEQIYERSSFQNFLHLTSDEDIPDETSICRFRKRLIEHNMDTIIFWEIDSQIESHGLKLQTWKIVDATILEAPKGKKKDDGSNTRDKDAGFTKKNGRTYHGFKWHVSTDLHGDFIHKDFVSSATDHDSKHEDKVTDWDEPALFEDSAYISKEKKKKMRKEWRHYWIVERATRWHPLTTSQKKRNKKNSSIRVKWEHPFAEIKIRMNFKVRYKWERKNKWDFRMVCTAYNMKRLVSKFFSFQKQAVVCIT